jgi:hypothetical protein
VSGFVEMMTDEARHEAPVRGSVRDIQGREIPCCVIQRHEIAIGMLRQFGGRL